MVEYLTDWVMGTSNQAADDDIKCLTRDLDQASMEAVVSLLAGLPLQPEEGDGVELMEAKSQLFLKYASQPLLLSRFIMHYYRTQSLASLLPLAL